MMKKRCFIVDEMIYPGFHVLSGDPKIGKSWMMMDMCLAIAKGKKFLGRKTEQGHVVYMALEDTSDNLLSAFQSRSEAETPISRPHSVWCCDWKPCVSAYRSCRICSFTFPPINFCFIDSRRDLLSMYLPQEAQKSFTAAVVALGGVVSRTATNTVKNGSHIADSISITWFSGKKKRTRFQCFHIS